MMKRTLKILLLSLVCICSFFVLAACKEKPSGVDSSQDSSQATDEYFLLKDTALSLVVGDEYTLVADYYVEQGGELAFLKIVIQHCLSSAYCSMISASTLAVSSARFSML